jgi:hypothetical protein
MKDTYLQLLEFLEPWGIDREVEIEAQLYEWFTHQLSVDPLEPHDSINARIERFLDVISENKHIFFAKQKIRVEGKEDMWQVQVRLTFLGLQYLNEHRLTVSNINLNHTIKRNSYIQIGIGIVTLVAIGFTTVYSILAYKKDDPIALKKIDTLLQRQVQQLDSIRLLQKERNIYLKIMAKKTLPKKN